MLLGILYHCDSHCSADFQYTSHRATTMLVLDGLRASADGAIEIPPFHTGHLGFVPKTQVSLNLLGMSSDAPEHCELVVTPFAEDMKTMFRLQCTTHDRPGIVHLLIDAVASLGLNIVKLDSSVINYQKHHFVEMIVDWHRSNFKEELITPSHVAAQYDQLRSRIPLHDMRYVWLYESIMANCGPEVLFDRAYGAAIPLISMRPFVSSESAQAERVDLEHHDDRANWSRLPIPREHLTQIRYRTEHDEISDTSPLPYVLCSDTDTRVLRVLIPKKASVPRLIHIGFLHLNVPGAGQAITRAMAEADFNIITCLLRTKRANQSSLELLAEYQGDCVEEADHLPRVPFRSLVSAKEYSERYVEQLQWLYQRLTKVSGKCRRQLEQFSVSVCPPEYPKIKSDQQFLLSDGHASHKKNGKRPQRTRSRARQLQQIKASIKRLSKPKMHSEFVHTELENTKRRFLEEIRERVARKKPLVFLSYPSDAQVHALLIKKALEKRFNYDEYQSADFEPIVDSVRERIHRCDFFLGIWHHERTAAGLEYTVSPWMPFEYGVSVSSEKNRLIIYSDKLPEQIWKRIDSGTSTERYSDVSFLESTVPKVLSHCIDHWLLGWETDMNTK